MNMFSYGTQVKDTNAALSQMSLSQLYEYIRDSPQGLVSFTKNLRSVLKYSQDRYRVMKTQLPFFSCSHFDPPRRGNERFTMAIGLVIDIDSEHGISPELIQKLKIDPRVALGYISPSGRGVKLIFIFDEPITSKDSYQRFYKIFSQEFAHSYHIFDLLDQKNGDVSRISFLCHDPEAWYLEDFIPIDWKNHPLMGHDSDGVPKDIPITDEQGLPQQVYHDILKKLDRKPKIIKPKPTLHTALEALMPTLEASLADYQVRIESYEALNYGVKLKMSYGKDQAEVNVYTGRKGYSVVVSARKGTQAQLNELCKTIIENAILHF